MLSRPLWVDVLRVVAAEESRGIAEARRAVPKSDIERKAFFKQTYNVDPLNADPYDLTLDSDYLRRHDPHHTAEYKVRV